MTPVAPCGAWRSPIAAADVARAATRLSEPGIERDAVVWSERRPQQGGRTAIVQWRDGEVADLVPEPWNARTRVHEYGGGAAAIFEHSVFGDAVLFSHYADGRVYRLGRDGNAVALTPQNGGAFADLCVDSRRQRLLAIREAGPQSQATIVAIDIDIAAQDHEARTHREPTVLVAGPDFLSNPRPSPDGRQLSWLSWDHPNMPWDGTRLWVAEVDAAGVPQDARCVAGGPSESIFQPEWSPDGVLHFVSDESGWWNLHRASRGFAPQSIRNLAPMAAECGLPQWLFGMRTYAFADAATVVCAYHQQGRWRLGRLNLDSGHFETICDRYTWIDGVVADSSHAVFIASAPDRPAAVVRLELSTGATEELRRTASPAPDPRFLSSGSPIEFSSTDGAQAHGFFYPPVNSDYRAPDGERPPLIVRTHGGPTAAADDGYDLAIQFWTSRGFAVVDVNYGGSTGYGREYRQRLDGAWGVVDVDDCVAAARSLCASGLVDPDRLLIRGGSAGGFTVLAALAFRKVFRAGASYYGVGDLAALAHDTHKFESRYLDRLVAPLAERPDLYRARSPLYAADSLSCPVIFFQGLEDKVVPPSQTEAMASVLERRSVPVALVEFAGEGHGFRQAANIASALEAELSFYAQILGFDPGDPIPQIAIKNL